MRAALAADQTRSSGSSVAPVRAAAHTAALAGECAEAPSAAPDVATPLTPADVLRMATLEGARALGWADMVGSLEVGKRADLTVVRLREGGCQADAPAPRAEGVEALLVSCASGPEVQATIVEGRFVFERDAAQARDHAQITAVYDDARRKLGLPPLRLTGEDL